MIFKFFGKKRAADLKKGGLLCYTETNELLFFSKGAILMGKFVIIVNEKGDPHFNLLATNGQVIGTSEVYKTMSACKNGIDSVKRCVEGGIEDQTVEGFEEQKHPKFVVSQDKAGKFRFNLKAKNGEIILSSQGYVTKDSCLNGINSVKNNAPDAAVVDAE